MLAIYQESKQIIFSANLRKVSEPKSKQVLFPHEYWSIYTFSWETNICRRKKKYREVDAFNIFHFVFKCSLLT